MTINLPFRAAQHRLAEEFVAEYLPRSEGDLFELLSDRFVREVFAALRGLADWLASRLYRAKTFEPLPVPTLDRRTHDLIAERYGVETWVVAAVYDKLSRSSYILPPVGRFEDGRLHPNRDELERWASQFRWENAGSA